MTLLFITQKLSGQDAFAVLWVQEFRRQGYDVTVLCLEASQATYDFPVHSLGKERGSGKLAQVLRFERLITTLPYDRVFIHMTPIWAVFGLWWWVIRGKPVYCWYTHYRMQWGVRLLRIFGKRLFCATAQSLPQLQRSQKKVVVGHGIDLAVWMQRKNQCKNPRKLLMVHRLSRSKRMELVLHALALLPRDYTLDIYGEEAEADYAKDMKELTTRLRLNSRVTFHGTVPMQRLPEIYVRHALILNMASETIDKTMLEAMTCGCYPVTTKANARAIGLLHAPDDVPDSIARFVSHYSSASPLGADQMYAIVAQQHSLEGLVRKMDEYIRSGR